VAVVAVVRAGLGKVPLDRAAGAEHQVPGPLQVIQLLPFRLATMPVTARAPVELVATAFGARAEPAAAVVVAGLCVRSAGARRGHPHLSRPPGRPRPTGLGGVQTWNTSERGHGTGQRRARAYSADRTSDLRPGLGASVQVTGWPGIGPSTDSPPTTRTRLARGGFSRRARHRDRVRSCPLSRACHR
jgi:hypothetical protein